ncbi:MAG: hypothetical protein GX977_03415 [Firmicutes bacterium]|nr:hypothetical protein [Bacillota bacterium]
MEAYNSRLDFLMDKLGITGRELATAIHVDPSLVSKWRNSHRLLSKRSIHLPKMAEYFAAYDSSPSLREILEAHGSEVNWDNREELLGLLCRWLTNPSPLPVSPLGALASHSHYSQDASYTVYMGNDGRREAVLQFLDHILTLPQGQQLYLMSQEDLAWLTEDKDFLTLWQAKLAQVLQNRHKIRIIHWVDRSVDSLNSIIGYWLPLHLTGGIESWFFPKYSDSPFQATFFILENDLAITGMSSPNLKDRRYTAMFRDPITIKQCQWVFSTYLSDCYPLIEVCPKREMQRILEKTTGPIHTGETAYLIWEPPLFATMSQGLLASILTRNNLDGYLVQECQGYHQQVASTKYSGISRLLYSIDGLKQALQGAQFLCEELTTITGHPIQVTKEDLIRYIHELVESLRANKGLEVAFFSAPERAPVNLLLRDPDMVMAWSRGLPYAAAVSEPTVVKAFVRYYDELWQSIPRVNRDRTWVIGEILKLIT